MSNIISNAYVGSWEYYVFSDNTAIWRAMNGLAAWFNGSGGMIQSAAWLGSLVLLCVVLFGASIRKQVASAGTIGAWFFFMTTTGITGQAQIHNIYTGQVTVVNNVPALALVPASVFSKATYQVFLTMDTAFQSTSGSYMSVSQNGFVGPLEVLLAMRSNKIAVMRPDLILNLTRAMKDCLPGMDPVPPGAGSLNDAKDGLAYLAEYGRKNGITTQFSVGDLTEGTLVNCGEALTDINAQFEQYVQDNSAGGIKKLINAETTKKNPMDANGFWSSADISKAHAALLNVSSSVSQSAIEFSKNALSAATVTYMRECMYNLGLMTSQNVCTASGYVEGDQLEKWKASAAMAGSGFLKTMFTSMGILQALFFALFPAIAIYGLVLPQQSGKVFVGYILFGAWCQSWLIVVAPLQAYIQTSIVDEITKIVAGSAGGVTYANMMSVYVALSTKLAVASDLMASAQLLSLGLLTGSMMTLNSIAEKWSGSQQIDPTKLQLDGIKNAAMLETPSIGGQAAPILHKDGSVGVYRKYGGGEDFAIETSASNETTSGYSSAQGRNYGSERAAVKSYGTQDDKERAYATETRVNDALTTQIAADLGVTKTKAAEIVKSASSLIEANGQVTTDVARALGVGFRDLFKSQGIHLSAGQAKQLDAQIAAGTAPGLQTAANQLAARDANFFQKLYGTAGAQAQSEAFGALIDTATPIIGAGITLAGTASTLGVGAPAAAMAGVGASAAIQAAKPMMLQKLKEAGTNVASGLADKSRAGNFAAALGGGVDAAYKAATSSAFDERDTVGSGLSSTKTTTVTGSNTTNTSKAWTDSTKSKEFDSNLDSFTQKWANTANEEWRKGMTESRGDSFKTTITHESLMTWAVDGRGGLTGAQMRVNAAITDQNLRLGGKYTDDRIKEVDKEVDALLSNRPEGSYRHPSISASELKDYFRNVIFERKLTGRNVGALSQQPISSELAPPPSSVRQSVGQPVQEQTINTAADRAYQATTPTAQDQANNQLVSAIKTADPNMSPAQVQARVTSERQEAAQRFTQQAATTFAQSGKPEDRAAVEQAVQKQATEETGKPLDDKQLQVRTDAAIGMAQGQSGQSVGQTFLGSQIPAMPTSLVSASDQLNARPSDKLKDVSSAMPPKPAPVTYKGAEQVVNKTKADNDTFVSSNDSASLKDSKLSQEKAAHEGKSENIVLGAAAVSGTAKAAAGVLGAFDNDVPNTGGNNGNKSPNKPNKK
jgi:hypothetical protein